MQQLSPTGLPHTPGEGQGELKQSPKGSWAAMLARRTAQQNPFYSYSRSAQAAFSISFCALRAGVCPRCFLQPEDVVNSLFGPLTAAVCLSPLAANRACCALGIGQNRNKPSKSEGNKLLYGHLHFTCLKQTHLEAESRQFQGRKDAGCFSSTLYFPFLQGIHHITRKKGVIQT